MKVLIAIPTIDARPGLAEKTADRWRELTPGADVETIISTAGDSWGDGLNDVVSQLHMTSTDVLICGSDDMVPADDLWLPTVQPWLAAACFPVPRVDDPRFVNYGGPDHPSIQVEDGTPTTMSTFPILRGDWLPRVFPLPDGLHYFADNLISALLWRDGIQAVAVPSCRILHLHAQEGRGAGYGSENTRLHIDTVRYSRALAERGIDRASLPGNLRGHMWEEAFLEVGRGMGA